MAKQKFELARGVQDWLGKDAILRNYIKDTLRKVFERYGYNPIETPIIERAETLSFKGGGEIQKEVFRLQDQGGRDLALRFDQTVPLARFYATHPDVKLPFKRYVIGEVFRDGPAQPEQGRYRAFTQCDVDVLGIKEMTAEAELFALAQDAFRELGLGDVEVKINNRKLLDGILDYAGVQDYAKLMTIITLDKRDRIGLEGVREELLSLSLLKGGSSLSNETLVEVFDAFRKRGLEIITSGGIRTKIVSEVDNKGYEDILALFRTVKDESELFSKVADYKTAGGILLTPENVSKLMDAIQLQGTSEETYRRLEQIVSSPKGREGLAEVKQLLDYSSGMGLDFIQFDPSLARGLDYYTGTTIEVYLKDKALVSSAILAGGRYDDMVGDFVGGKREIPAVGYSFGLERLAMILENSIINSRPTTTDIYLIPIATTEECLGIAHMLRNQGLNVDMDLQGRRAGQNIRYADSVGIPYVGLVGQNELEAGMIKIKKLATGQQEEVRIKDVSKYLKRG